MRKARVRECRGRPANAVVTIKWAQSCCLHTNSHTIHSFMLMHLVYYRCWCGCLASKWEHLSLLNALKAGKRDTFFGIRHQCFPTTLISHTKRNNFTFQKPPNNTTTEHSTINFKIITCILNANYAENHAEKYLHHKYALSFESQTTSAYTFHWIIFHSPKFLLPFFPVESRKWNFLFCVESVVWKTFDLCLSERKKFFFLASFKRTWTKYYTSFHVTFLKNGNTPIQFKRVFSIFVGFGRTICWHCSNGSRTNYANGNDIKAKCH